VGLRRTNRRKRWELWEIWPRLWPDSARSSRAM